MVVDVAVAAGTVFKLATTPRPPPERDGCAHGTAAIAGSVILVSALGLVPYGVVLWLAFVVLAAGIAVATLVWRLAEAVVRILSRSGSGGAP